MNLMSNRRAQPVLSPCVGVCTLDELDYCLGCHRTADEITHWLEYSDAEREDIMDALEERARRRVTA